MCEHHILNTRWKDFGLVPPIEMSTYVTAEKLTIHTGQEIPFTHCDIYHLASMLLISSRSPRMAEFR